MDKESNMVFLSAGRHRQLIQREMAYNTIVNLTGVLLYNKDTGVLTEYERIMNWFINTMVDLEV